MTNKQSFSLTHLSHPPRAASEGKAPAILLLHGFGANDHDLMGLADYFDPRFHVISARAPITMGPNMYAWYWIQMLPNGDFSFSPDEVQRSLALIDSFMGEVIENYDLDPDRFFLVGFSQGAIQSCATLLLTPEKVAGVVSMSGRWPGPAEAVRAADERLAGKPVLAVHGLYDPVIPIRYARELKEKFESLPVAFTYQEFPMAHSTSMESVRLVSQWLSERLDG